MPLPASICPSHDLLGPFPLRRPFLLVGVNLVRIQGVPLVLFVGVFIVSCLHASSAYPLMDPRAGCLLLLSGGYLLLAIVRAVLCQGSVVLLIVTVSGVDPTVPRPFSGTFKVGVFAVRGCVSFEMAEGASGFDVGPTAWECRWALSSTYPNRHPSFFV